MAALEIGPLWPCAWFVMEGTLQLYRYSRARSLQKFPPPSAAAILHRLTAVFGLIGVCRALILPTFFWASHTGSESAFLVTMVIAGLSAGGVTSAAGVVGALVAWGLPIFAVLVAGWVWRGGVYGYAVAALLLLLFAILLAYVKDQRQMIEELVRLADDKETLSRSLQRERDKAEAANEARTRFFAAANHDLRQPLHALSINATTLALMAKRSSDSLLRDVSRGIDSALSRSQSLLNGLIDISRLDAHAVETRLVPVDVSMLLRATWEEYAALAAQKRLEFKVVCDPGPVCGITDSDQLSRIIGNLVNNAIKFTVSGSVCLELQRVGSELLLRVRDTGPGVPSEEHEKVFEEFYQGHASRNSAQGLGLGLAIVKRTCQLLDIRLRFTSSVSVGTTFELAFAAWDPPCAAPPAFAPPPEVSPDTEDTDVVHSALVIDDEIEVVESLERYLTAVGWTVRGGADGAEAEAAILEGYQPDVLVVDYRLRDETGLDVIARLRKRLPALPAVIITGDTAPQRLRELAEQATAVLHKPVDGVRLAKAVSAAVAVGTKPSVDEKTSPACAVASALTSRG